MERLWHHVEDVADDVVAGWLVDPRPRPRPKRHTRNNVPAPRGKRDGFGTCRDAYGQALPDKRCKGERS